LQTLEIGEKTQAESDNIEIRIENEIDQTNQEKKLNQKIMLGFSSKDEGEILSYEQETNEKLKMRKLNFLWKMQRKIPSRWIPNSL
jgi:S-adenosylmethionine synthetase